MKEIYIY